MLRYIVVVLILLAAVAMAWSADVQALVAFVLFARLTERADEGLHKP
jgi:hypothetical protein